MSLAVVLGGAESVWDDLSRLQNIVTPDLVIAVNDVGCHRSNLDHWVSLHPECFYRVRGDESKGWFRERRANGHDGGYISWGPSGKKRYKVDMRMDWEGGDSGLFGTMIGLKLAERVVLCGIPMTRTRHFRQSTAHDDEPWEMADTHWKRWACTRTTTILQGRVKSMSGRTEKLLGRPDPVWLGLERAA